jgi:hypothetical protein
MAFTNTDFISSQESSGQLTVPGSLSASSWIFHVTISEEANVYLRWGLVTDFVTRMGIASDVLTNTGTIYYTGVSPILNVEWNGNTGIVGVSYIALDFEEDRIGGPKFRKVYESDLELGKNSGRYVRVYRSRRFPNK